MWNKEWTLSRFTGLVLCLGVAGLLLLIQLASAEAAQRLTGGGLNLYGEYSPDGKKITYAHYVDGVSQIFIMNSDGSGATNLSSNGVEETWPSFSPDGKRVIFTAESDGPFAVIKTMNVNGADRNLVFAMSDSATMMPRWDPDGSRIIFSYDPPDAGLCIGSVNASGGDFRQIACDNHGSTRYVLPQFSPAGNKIVFQQLLTLTESVLLKANPDGSGMEAMPVPSASSQGTVTYGNPTFTGDETVMYVSNWETPGDPNNTKIYTQNLDGSGLTRFESSNGFLLFPSMAPNRNTVLYTDGTNLTSLAPLAGEADLYSTPAKSLKPELVDPGSFRVTLKGKKRVALKLLARRGYKVKVSCTLACSLRLSITAKKGIARRVFGLSSVTVTSAKKSLSGAKLSKMMTLRIKKRAQRSILRTGATAKRLKKVRLVLNAVATTINESATAKASKKITTRN